MAKSNGEGNLILNASGVGCGWRQIITLRLPLPKQMRPTDHYKTDTHHLH